MNKIDLEKFKKLKKETEIYYKKVGSIYCPALKSDIVFNSNGFVHLKYNSNRGERSKIIQKNKFVFLKDSIRVLKKTTTLQEYRRMIIKKNIVEWFGFFAVIDFKNKIRIKVIVRRLGAENGKYHFWSVMPF